MGNMRHLALRSAAALGLACATPAQADQQLPQFTGTQVFDSKGLERLLKADDLTLQWIDWNRRGKVELVADGDYLRLSGFQQARDGPGRLELDGKVIEVGSNYFIFEGKIRITDTPDVGRTCEATKIWHFAITQNRKYYRLREFEWCDGLTDYVDVYF
jgi:hypothetical protein